MNTENKGMLLGFVGIFIFSLTLPITKIAVQTFDPYFLAYARAAFAGILAIGFLVTQKASLPTLKELPKYAWIALGTVYVFPILINVAMTDSLSSHSGVILGIMPLATASAGVFLYRDRPSWGFWATAVLGCFLVVLYGLLEGEGSLSYMDYLLIMACLFLAVSYAVGGELSKLIDAKIVISWTLVLSLPINLIGSYFSFKGAYFSPSAEALISFLYLSMFSMFIGFFFWYGGLALGGVARVSQVQLLQPFCTLVASAFFLGEIITPRNILFASLVVATVMLGKRMLIKKAKPEIRV
jgi:drug/metabolite transporter (DMT)-like permease